MCIYSHNTDTTATGTVKGGTRTAHLNAMSIAHTIAVRWFLNVHCGQVHDFFLSRLLPADNASTFIVLGARSHALER